MAISNVKNRYKNRAKEVGSVFLLKPSDALNFIEECVASGLKLEGVEGFSITEEGAYQPHQEHSNDISDAACNQREFVEETKKFICERIGTGIWFEVVFSEHRNA